MLLKTLLVSFIIKSIFINVESSVCDPSITCPVSVGGGVLFTDVVGRSVAQFKASGTIWFSSDALVDILVVGGGGNGGSSGQSGACGGGGAGTVIFATDVLLRGDTTLPITVGGAGQASSIGTDFVAAAGGNGVAGWSNGVAWIAGYGGGVQAASTVFGVTGITTSENAFGNAGVSGSYNQPIMQEWGGAGGGAGGPGRAGACGGGGLGLSRVNISGDISVFSDVFGQAYTSVASYDGAVAGGGAGGTNCNPNNYGCGSSNGLGGSAGCIYTNGMGGLANTGSGGGGGARYTSNGGPGGSGLVLIRGAVNCDWACTLICTTCLNSNFYVAGCTGTYAGDCVGCDSCPAGTYRIGCGGRSPGVCKACISCPFAQYAVGCSLESDGVCTPCQTCPPIQPEWPMYRYACYGIKPGICNVCDLCPAGYFRKGCNETSFSSGTCELCTCPAGQYMVGCSSYSTSDCVNCDASGCPAGQFLSGCSGTSPGTCISCSVGFYKSGTSCVPCAAGTYSTVAGLTAPCPACPTCSRGQYRNLCGAASSGVCTGCTNSNYSSPPS
jgi:hypothetical protein